MFKVFTWLPTMATSPLCQHWYPLDVPSPPLVSTLTLYCTVQHRQHSWKWSSSVLAREWIQTVLTASKRLLCTWCQNSFQEVSLITSSFSFPIFVPSGPSLKVAQELLQAGANLNARTCWGDTAAHYAARHGPVCVLR